jgi:hypothetical protein
MPINEMPGCRIAARQDGSTRRPRLAAAKLAVLGVPAVALLMSAGVASAATTQLAAAHAVDSAHQAAAAEVSWHNLNLINGWQTASGCGSPLYAISNGVVYLTGGLAQPTPGSLCSPRCPRPRGRRTICTGWSPATQAWRSPCSYARTDRWRSRATLFRTLSCSHRLPEFHSRSPGRRGAS